jgi:BirA family biotin operon repressor/biotin-[acetyl-CoA-carboxylase] ligase
MPIGNDMTLSQSLLEQVLTRPFRYYDQVDSTNDVARAWLEAGAPAGAVVIAGEQTRGRGRHGRRWHTPPGAALALSVILKPSAAFLPRLNMLAALSVFDLAQAIGCRDVGIKWPNDVQACGRKLSGVLVEAIWEGDQLVGAVVGIGVNVCIDFSDSPLRDSAISLEDVVKRPLDRAQLISDLLGRIDHWYKAIATGSVQRAWRARLTTLHQAVVVNNIAGVAINVTPDGALLIRDANGRVHQTEAGELVVSSKERLR